MQAVPRVADAAPPRPRSLRPRALRPAATPLRAPGIGAPLLERLDEADGPHHLATALPASERSTRREERAVSLPRASAAPELLVQVSATQPR